MSWTARVLLHVEDVAFVQLPGGTLAVRDAQRLLQDGDTVSVTAMSVATTTPAPSNPYMLGPYRVRSNGQGTLLLSDAGMVPLLLRAGERLPEQVFLLVNVEAAEQAEGAEPTPASPTPGASHPAPKVLDANCGCHRTFISPLEIYLRFAAQSAATGPTP